MITVPLTLQYCEHAVRKPVAWFLPGADPAVWLAEIVHWTAPHKTLRLLPLPQSRTDRRPLGLLVAPSGAEIAGVSERCVPFGVVAGRLFLPIDARLEPELCDRDLQSLLSAELTCAWHPACGLIAFEDADVLSVTDLLSVAPCSGRLWNRAMPGVACTKRLSRLAPAQTLTLEQVMEEGQDGIGSDADSIEKLPPSPLEPGKGLAGAAARQAVRLLAGAAAWFVRQVPATASSPTWVNGLQDWASQRLAHLAAGRMAARNKEIARLMHLLETDPDRGLRFALPMGGAAHRGLARGGDRLGEHDVNFRLGSLRGGGPADIWRVPADYAARLAALYRNLANREIRLGRHRRAAYIFAELLGDYDGAANALASGHHWREAAVIYQQRLHRPLDAARCLEQGGLWTEAIALYQELGYHEKAGDLFRNLDQLQDAETEYRKAIVKHRENRDFLSAARLLDDKLESAGEAIEVLALGWPASAQAGQCLREVFRIHGRLGRHDGSLAWIDRLRREHHGAASDAIAAETLADLALAYPDQEVKDRAADSTRAIVSRSLTDTIIADQRRLLSAIARLVPEDRLLARDCQRYLQPPTPPSPRPLQKPHGSGRVLRLVHTIRLPQGVVTATTSGKAIYVACAVDRGLIVCRSSWQKADHPGAAWLLDKPLSQPSVILCAAPHGDPPLVCHVVGRPPLATIQTLAMSDQFSSHVRVGPVPGLSAATLAAARDSGGTTWIVEPRNGQLCLIAIGPHGEQTTIETIPSAGWPSPSGPQEEHEGLDCFHGALYARGEKVYLGLGNQVAIFGRSKMPEIQEFSRAVKSLTGSALNTRPRIAATFERGGEVFWDDFETGNHQPFAHDMPDPMACFNRGGYLIAACERKCEVYSTQDRRLQLEAEMSISGPSPVAVLGAPRTDQFGIVTENGEIRVYELTRS